jgi:hypothetical protein
MQAQSTPHVRFISAPLQATSLPMLAAWEVYPHSQLSPVEVAIRTLGSDFGLVLFWCCLAGQPPDGQVVGEGPVGVNTGDTKRI